MITHVTLRNWKAYQALDLPLESGTTFIVSPNGVGKTSLLEAIRWGLLGSSSDVDAEEARRGEGSASVSLEISLDAGLTAHVTRSIDPPDHRGRTKEMVQARTRALDEGPHSELDGQDAWAAFLTDHWGATPGLLARLVSVPEDAIFREIQSPTAFLVLPHIRRSLNLDELERGREAAESARRLAADQSTRLRATMRAQARSAAELLEARESHVREVEGLGNELRQVQSELAQHRRLEDHRASWSSLARAHEDFAGKQEALQLELGASGISIGELSAATELGLRLDSLQQQRRELRDREVSLGAQRDSISHHLGLLDAGHGDCPTCLRPLDEGEAQNAAARHRDALVELDRELASLGAEDAELRVEETRLREWMLRASEPAPAPLPAPPDDLVVGPLSDEAAETLGAREQSLSDRTGELRFSLGQLDRDMEQLAREEAETKEAYRLYRQEGLAELLRKGLDFAIERLTDAAVDPLKEAVTTQWKRTLELGSLLHVGLDGSIEANREGRVVSFAGLSGGEKAFALLVHRVVTIRMLTASPLLLLDEPLERLDPRNRLTMARLISDAARPSGLQQVLVTTYEEGLVRSLIEDERRRAQRGAGKAEHLHMLHVRTSQRLEAEPR